MQVRVTVGGAAPGGGRPGAWSPRCSRTARSRITRGDGRHAHAQRHRLRSGPGPPDRRRRRRGRRSARRHALPGTGRVRPGRHQCGWTRSRSGTMSQRSARRRRSSSSGHASATSAPVCTRRAAFERHATGVLADRVDLCDLGAGQQRHRRHARQLLALGARPAWPAGPGSWISVGTTHSTERLGERPLAGELQRREPVPVADRAQLVEPGARLADPTRRPERAVVVRREVGLVGQVVVEHAAVIDHARERL